MTKTTGTDATRVEALEATNKELLELLHDHDIAWDCEEESVKEEHAELIERTRDVLKRTVR